MPLRDALLPEFDREMGNTRKILELVPNDKLGWKPHPKSGTLGWLASHVAEIPDWLGTTLDTDSFDFAPPGAEPYKTTQHASHEAMVAAFDKFVAQGRESLAKASDERMMGNWSLMGGGHVFFTMPRIAVVRAFVLSHLIHHRAQLVLYLRMNDIAIPGMYGPSADEKM